MTSWERTGWRDREISSRHRRWGFECPAVDVDFLLIEYHRAEPVAIVEYKHYRAARPQLSQPSYRALLALAERAPKLPFLIARYWPDTWAFEVTSVNNCAQKLFGPLCRLSERQYVTALHALRSAPVHERVLRHLNDCPPPQGSAILNHQEVPS